MADGVAGWAAALLVLAGVGMLLLAVRSLTERARGRRHGRLVHTDRAGATNQPLVSSRYRISGRPDAVRVHPDGRWVPVEVKSRSSPPRGPLPSHRVQVEAYCLLVEETTGRSPPYGLLQYADGGEFSVPWDGRARAELLQLRRDISRPYDGRAEPSPGKCRACLWRLGCDARAD